MQSRNILVTGAAGFIGSNLVDRLLKHRYKVIGVDNLLTGNLKNIKNALKNPLFKFEKVDVNHKKEISKIFSEYKSFDFIFHYAACVGVQRTLSKPLMVLSDIEGIKNILNLAKSTNIKRVFFSSSSEVYGESAIYPQNEKTTPLNSKLPYAVVKNVAENFIKSYQKEYSINYTIFRFFNTYGPRQSADFVISKFIRSALAGDDIPIFGNGLQTRSFLYIEDNIEATTKAISEKNSINKIINIGSNKEISILEIANTIKKITDSKSKIKLLPPLKEGDMSRRLPDIRAMEMLLKFSPHISFEEGLKKTIKYFQSSKT